MGYRKTDEGKTLKITLRITPTEKQIIAEEAKRLGIGVSELLVSKTLSAIKYKEEL